LLCFLESPTQPGRDQKPLRAWDEYIQKVDSRTKQEVSENGPFLWVDQEPLRAARARGGEILAEPEIGGKASQAVLDGLIHDWTSAVFIPGVTLAQVFAATDDYDRYREFYRPTVVEAALLCWTGEEEALRIRYLQKVLFMTEVLDSEYRLHSFRLDARRWYSISQSTRLQEIADQGGNVGRDTRADEGNRYIWRIYGIAKYESETTACTRSRRTSS
jgi:hypothetical protein